MALRFLFGLLALITFSFGAVCRADDGQVPRGKYLVNVIGCSDCHTPGYFFGKLDETHFLAGSDVGFAVGDLGVFVAPNLTSDNETGLGAWSPQQIATAIKTGVRPDGRILAPIMPWRDFAALTEPDVVAIVAYLRSLPPVKNKVPGPFGKDEKALVFVMKIVPPDATPPKN